MALYIFQSWETSLLLRTYKPLQPESTNEWCKFLIGRRYVICYIDIDCHLKIIDPLLAFLMTLFSTLVVVRCEHS
jgi:hypothetical protein